MVFHPFKKSQGSLTPYQKKNFHKREKLQKFLLCVCILLLQLHLGVVSDDSTSGPENHLEEH